MTERSAHQERISAAMKLHWKKRKAMIPLRLEKPKARKYRNVPSVVDGVSISDVDRFWSKVEIGDATECWPWKAGCFRHGYGQFSFGGRKNLRKIGAHRFALAISEGVLRPDHVLHSCDNPKCVNPAHLRYGTQLENILDAKERGRTASGERNGSSKLTTQAAAEIRRRRASGESYSQIAPTFQVSTSLIGYVCQGKIWKPNQ